MNTWSKKNNRVVGEKGSPQNRLRYELYSEGFERIDKGLKEGNHFEVVSIVDSIIVDRLTSLLQKTKDEEELDTSIQSVGKIIKTLLSDIKHNRLDIGENKKEFKELLIKIENEWVPKRNFTIHSFVVVSEHNKHLSKEERLQIVKECSLEGSEYCKKLRTLTDKVINNLE